MVCNVKMRKYYFLAFIVALVAGVTGYLVIWFTRKDSIFTVSEKKGLARLKSLGIGPRPLLQAALWVATPDSAPKSEEQIPAAPSALAEVFPTNVVAQVGTVARFNCTSTNDDPVYWQTTHYGSAETKEIYIGEKLLVDDYGRSERFSVEVDSTLRRYDLVINDTKQSDAGVYICTAERGSGNKSSAELVVWDALTCEVSQRQDSYMGDNVFHLKQEAIIVTCSINYKGNIRPYFMWDVGGREFNEIQRPESGIASSSLIFPATSKLDGTNVTFKVAIRDNSSEVTRTGVLWTSDTINVKYAVLANESVKECPGVENTLKCNPPCSYKREIVDDRQKCTVCYSTGLCVKLFYAYISPEKDTRYLIAITALAAVSCFVSITFALRYLIKKLSLRRKMGNKNTEKKLLNNEERQNAADNS